MKSYLLNFFLFLPFYIGTIVEVLNPSISQVTLKKILKKKEMKVRKKEKH